MKLVILFGPPAVGKMTVGQELARTTGLRLFHNHMTIDLLLNFFAFGTKEFARLNALFRDEIFNAVAASELPGLIFTYVWALNDPRDKAYVDRIASVFLGRGANIYYVELQADLQVRLRRNTEMTRLEQKPSKRDVAATEALLLRHDKEYELNTSEQRLFFYAENYLKIDNTDLPAVEVAAIIKSKFSL
jgi:adenylate kinase family enzyme